MSSTTVQRMAVQAKQSLTSDYSHIDPSSALVSLTTIGSFNTTSPLSCKLTTTNAAKKITDLHRSVGHSGFDISGELASGSKLLESLVAAFDKTLVDMAQAMNIALEGGTISCTGKLDFSGTLGVKDNDGFPLPVKFTRISINLRLECGEEHKGQIPSLISAAERSCAVLQTIRRGVDVHIKIGHLGRVGPDCMKNEHARVIINSIGTGVHRSHESSITMISV